MRIFVGTKAHPGTVPLHIQARPLEWLARFGSVPALKPSGDMIPMMLQLVKDRREKKPEDFGLLQAYRVAYWEHCRRVDMRPGKLLDATGEPVREDVTLVCTCSRDEARAGRCHRVWSAWWLNKAGWEVIGDWCGSE